MTARMGPAFLRLPLCCFSLARVNGGGERWWRLTRESTRVRVLLTNASSWRSKVGV